MDVTAWLLDSDPSVRWQALRDLQNAPPAELAVERARVANEGFGARLLAEQSDDGYWNGEEYGEDGDRRSVIWTLQSLRRLGVDPNAPAVQTAIDRVRDGVIWKYWDELPFFHGEVEECANGGVLAIGAYFGVLGDGSDRIIDRLLSEQLPDGGWNCEPREESERSSFDSTICVLEGLLEYEQVLGSGTAPEAASIAKVPLATIAEARHRGEEYLLERALFRRKSSGEMVLPRYANFTFPPYWKYDVLRALDYLRATGESPDPRVADAVALMTSQRSPDGRWPAGKPVHGETYFAMDAAQGEPSLWNTLRALRVLRWLEA